MEIQPLGDFHSVTELSGGAASSTYPSIGGFGGGGGVGYSGGGGGGYSGGAGGSDNGDYPGGGGGGSYNSGTDQNNSIRTNSGHGTVIINLLGSVATSPVISQGIRSTHESP